MIRTSSPPLLQSPVVFVTGKGGVGKTTVAAALALQASWAGHPSALVEFEDGQAGQRALRDRASDVSHVVLTYDESLLDTLCHLLGNRFVARAIVSQRAIRRLIRAVPALREFVFLERVRALAEEKRFDRIVVDLPASGHALDWLRVPNAFARFLGRSPFGTMGRKIHQEIIAPGRADVVVVTLAEPLVVKETEQLCKRLRTELGISPALVVVNRTVSPDPEGAHEAVRRVASSANELSAAASEVQAIMEARAEQAGDTAYAFDLAQSLDARQIVALPEVAHDPAPAQVVEWLTAGAAA